MHEVETKENDADTNPIVKNYGLSKQIACMLSASVAISPVLNNVFAILLATAILIITSFKFIWLIYRTVVA